MCRVRATIGEREIERQRERERETESVRERETGREVQIYIGLRKRERERERDKASPISEKGGEFNARIRFHFWLCNTCYVIFALRVPSQFFTFQLQL
jgi:hypothetical protein